MKSCNSNLLVRRLRLIARLSLLVGIVSLPVAVMAAEQTQVLQQTADETQHSENAGDAAAQDSAKRSAGKSRYCTAAATGTVPGEVEDLKPMAVQISDMLRRQYCGK